jgi:hypothetical protein
VLLQEPRPYFKLKFVSASYKIRQQLPAGRDTSGTFALSLFFDAKFLNTFKADKNVIFLKHPFRLLRVLATVVLLKLLLV